MTTERVTYNPLSKRWLLLLMLLLSGVLRVAAQDPCIVGYVFGSLPLPHGSLFCATSHTMSFDISPPAGYGYSYQWQKYEGGVLTNVAGANSNVYSTSVAGLYHLRVEVTGTKECVVSSQLITVTGISAQPSHGVICDDHQFTVGVVETTGNTYRFQWQIQSEGGGWTNVVGAGATSMDYKPNMPGVYKGIVTENDVCPQETIPVTLIGITQQPVGPALGFICEGNQHPFSVELNNVPNPAAGHADLYTFSYAWQVKNSIGGWESPQGENITGLTDPIFYFGRSGVYRAVVSIKLTFDPLDIGCAQTTNEVELKVHGLPGVPVISARKTCLGDAFTATVTNNPIPHNGSDLIRYEWQRAGTLEKSDDDFVVPNEVKPFVINETIIEYNNNTVTLTVWNQCGSTASASINMWVESTPDLPTPSGNTEYCQFETPVAMSITKGDNPTKWFEFDESNPLVPGAFRPDGAPTPNANVAGIQKWWVSYSVEIEKYEDESGNPIVIACESGVTVAEATILPLPPMPTLEHTINYPPTQDDNYWEVCLNDVGVIITAVGTDIKWYEGNSLTHFSTSTEETVNTSVAKLVEYYVTQTIHATNRCESLKKPVTVLVRAISDIDALTLTYPDQICPDTETRVNVGFRADIVSQNPSLRWFKTPDKSVPLDPTIDGGYFGTETLLPYYQTPILQTRDDAYSYYVFLTYGNLCESNGPRTALIYSRDITLPWFLSNVLPPIVVDNQPNECFATIIPEIPLVADDCTPEEKLVLFISPPLAPNENIPPLEPEYTFNVGDESLMWWVQDIAGNRDYKLQAVQVRDREKPQGNCPVDGIDWYINENEYSAIVLYDLIFTDNCDGILAMDEKADDDDDDDVFRHFTRLRGLRSGSLFPLGVTPIRYLIRDRAGNVDTCDFNIRVQRPYRPMEVSLRVYPPGDQVCPNQPVIITPVINGGTGQVTYTWHPYGRSVAVMEDFPQSNTRYEVTISDGRTTFRESVDIRVLQRTPVTLSLDRPMENVFEGEPITVTATPGFESYRLLFENQVIQQSGINNVFGFDAELGFYDVQVFATDANGCVAQDFLRVWIESKKLPNVFTPNLDGLNDVFLQGYIREGDELEIYNRAGLLIYSTTRDGGEGWDGNYRGRLVPQGTYLYVLKRRMNNNEMRTFTGEVTLFL